MGRTSYEIKSIKYFSLFRAKLAPVTVKEMDKLLERLQ